MPPAPAPRSRRSPPAARPRTAASQPGDIITSLGGKAVDDSSALTALVDSHKAGDSVQVEVTRNGSKKSLTVKLGERPDTTATTPSSSNSPRRSQASAAAGSPPADGRNGARAGHHWPALSRLSTSTGRCSTSAFVKRRSV